MPVQKKKRSVIELVFHAVEVLIAFFLALMVLFTFLNVILRYVFNSGCAWSEEISRLCFIYLVYLGAIVAARDNAHLMVDALIARVPAKAQKVIYVAIQAITIWLLSMLVQGSWQWAIMKKGDVWPITRFPVFFINVAGAVLGVAYIAICIINLVRLIVGKEDPMVLLQPRHDEEEDELEQATPQKEDAE